MTEQKIKDETDQAVLEQINNKIIRHTIQFLHRVHGKLKPYGSGVFAKIYDDYFIITASHVASFFEEYPDDDLEIRVNKKLFINVLGDIKYTDIKESEGVDLAYIKLNEQMIEPLLKAYIPIQIDKFSSHNKLVYGNNYCVLGFPAVNVSKAGEPFDTGATFYITSPTNDNPYKYYKRDKSDSIILQMTGKGTNMKTNNIDKINKQFHGISGCGLWLLLISTNPLTGKIEVDYRLVGIMTDFRTGRHFCLIANKIHLIIDSLKAIEGFKFKERVINYELQN